MEEERETDWQLTLNGHDAFDACIGPKQFAIEIFRRAHHQMFKLFVDREIANEGVNGNDVGRGCGANGEGDWRSHTRNYRRWLVCG